jgi:hypothetical protein
MNALHHRMVADQLALIGAGLLLSGVQVTVLEADWAWVRSFSEAHRLATKQYDMENPWLDLRERLGARIDESGFDFDLVDSVLGSELYSCLVRCDLESKVGGDVEGDFFNIIKDYGNNSSEHSFWRSLWSAYSVGGWPCGWIEGVYPAGRLAVFDCKNWA